MLVSVGVNRLLPHLSICEAAPDKAESCPSAEMLSLLLHKHLYCTHARTHTPVLVLTLYMILGPNSLKYTDWKGAYNSLSTYCLLTLYFLVAVSLLKPKQVEKCWLNWLFAKLHLIRIKKSLVVVDTSTGFHKA